MNTKQVYTKFTFERAITVALLSFAANFQVVSAVFRDYIAVGEGGGLAAHGAGLEKEPIPEYLRSVVNCEFGTPHRSYPECRCGERVEIVPEEDIPLENLGDYHVRTKHTRKGIRNIFYHCMFCSLCPDGVRTQSNCSRMADTQCTTSCVKPTDYFDKGRKACVPDPRYQEATKKKVDVTNLLDANRLKATTGRPNGPFALHSPAYLTPNASSGKLIANDMYFIIVGWALVAAVLVVLIVNIFICKYFYHRRNHDQEKQRMLPHTISTASMTEGVDV